MSQQTLSYAQIVSKMIAVLQQDTLLQQGIRTEVEDMKIVVADFKKFYNTEDDEKQRIPYPYRQTNQYKYDMIATKISSGLEMVQDVIIYTKKILFETERNQNSNDNFNMSMQESSQPEVVVQGAEPRPKLLEKLTGVKKKKIVNKNDPYQSEIPVFKKEYQLFEGWDLHKIWHEEGTDFDEDEMKRFGYNAFLTNHKAIFSREVEPDLLRIYHQGLTLQRAKEKQIFGNVLTKSMTELKQQEEQRPRQ